MEHLYFDEGSYNDFLDMLRSEADEKYKAFNEKIIPGIGQNYGVRVPVLKDIAKKLSNNDNIKGMVDLLHNGESYEERLLEGLLISYVTYDDPADMFDYVENYIPRIDNWALCDGFVVSLKKLVTNTKPLFYWKIKGYIRSENPWEVRFGLILLNNYFSEGYHEEIFGMVENISLSDYYVKMGIAWLLSTIYFTNKDKVVKFLKTTDMDTWCVNKAVQKILESKKLDDSERELIKDLKR